MAEEKKIVERKKVSFDKKALSSRNKSKIEERKAEVEVPELNILMGLGDDETAIMIVRQMYFEELIETQQNQVDFMRNLVEGVLEAAVSKNAVEKEVREALSIKSPQVGEKINVVEKCLVEPKLTRQEIIYIGKMFPTVILRLYNKIMNLTNRGADLKKNSSG